jgi:DNA-binding SARP family transcriptional activator
MHDTELKALSAQVKKLTARVEALERLLQRIIQQKPVSERQLERALRVMRRSENASVR